jgi:hypothetical protein
MLEGDRKLVLDRRRGAARLFDLAADPAEQHDLAAAEPAAARAAAGTLRRALAEARAARPSGDGPTPALAPETRAQLEALGYVGGAEEPGVGVPPPRAPGSR